jgi:hypothetical protein
MQHLAYNLEENGPDNPNEKPKEGMSKTCYLDA